MGRNRAIGNRLRAGGSMAFSPSQITFTTGLWLDPSDISTGFQDSAGTTPQTASGQFTGKRLDKSGRGNHVTQSTSGARPEWDIIGGISSDYCDGSDDGYTTASGLTFGSAMDLFVTLKRATGSNMIVTSRTPADVSMYAGVIAAGNLTAGGAVGASGTAWTCFVNGVEVGSGANTASRDGLNTALGSGSYKVMEFRDLDLSTWNQFTLSLYTSFMLNADMAQLVLCPSQTTAIRNKLRTYCGAKGGLSL